LGCGLAAQSTWKKMNMMMADTFGEKRITRTDLIYGGSLAVVSLILGVNILMQSLIVVYLTIVLTLGALFIASEYFQEDRIAFRALWVLGALSLILYPVIDYIFERKLALVAYLTDDLKVLSTPLYVPLYWLLGIQLFGYFYHRVNGLIKKKWIAAIATGLFSAVSATFVETLFNAMGYYQNTISQYMIGAIPVYVPLGYLVAFSFLPIYLRYKYVCGFLLYGFVGICWYLFSLVLA